LTNLTIYPSLGWDALCVLVCLLCLSHTLMLVVASYWSLFTRDLAIGDNDQPPRRSTYVNIASAALVSMAIAVSFPAISLALRTNFSTAGLILAGATLGLGAVVLIVTIWKTWRFIGWKTAGQGATRLVRAYDRGLKNAYPFLNALTWIGLILLTLRWWDLCATESAGDSKNLALVGLSFSFRSVHPASGVSPVVPVMLLLLGWYLWAFFQTWRLRFSDDGRPSLPVNLADGHSPFFVSEDSLDGRGSLHGWLYRNITCPMITREKLCRFWKSRAWGGPYATIAIDVIVIVVFAGAVVLYSRFTPIDSVDHFLWKTGTHQSSPFEFLIAFLAFPLIALCVTGWIRLIVVWKSLKNDLLERLENQPIRFAFSRLKVMGWMTMLRHGGVQEQWRDMARSLESMRQILHDDDLRERIPETSLLELYNVNKQVIQEIETLRGRIDNPPTPGGSERDYHFVTRIEDHFADFAQKLLTVVLIPYWSDTRVGLVASEDIDELPIRARRSETPVEHPSLPMELHACATSNEPARILLTEEFLAIRYISLVRAVLSNMRYLMIFVSVSFALAMVAWNSYPLQPRQFGDGLFTGGLVLIGSGMVWVLAQMHRNPILSRIPTRRQTNWAGTSIFALPRTERCQYLPG
jgi:hypothetical protein